MPLYGIADTSHFDQQLSFGPDVANNDFDY